MNLFNKETVPTVFLYISAPHEHHLVVGVFDFPSDHQMKITPCYHNMLYVCQIKYCFLI